MPWPIGILHILFYWMIDDWNIQYLYLHKTSLDIQCGDNIGCRISMEYGNRLIILNNPSMG